MKKIFTTLLILLGVYTATQAQTKNEFGIGGGISRSLMYSSDQNNYTSAKTGFNLYLADELYFSNRWGIKIKVIYDQKGWLEPSVSSAFFSSPYSSSVLFTSYSNVHFNLNYITIPVMANWHFGHTRNWYLNFGPYVGFLTAASYDINKSADLKSSFTSTDAGLALGIGVKIPLSKSTKFFIEYDGQGGAGNVIKTGSNASTSRSSFNIGFDF